MKLSEIPGRLLDGAIALVPDKLAERISSTIDSVTAGVRSHFNDVIGELLDDKFPGLGEFVKEKFGLSFERLKKEMPTVVKNGSAETEENAGGGDDVAGTDDDGETDAVGGAGDVAGANENAGETVESEDDAVRENSEGENSDEETDSEESLRRAA